MAELPPMKIICRSSDATKIFTGPPAVGRAGELLSGSSAMVAFSKDGVWMCAVGQETVDLVTTHTMQQVRSLPINDILYVGFSPQATYLITCQRPMKGAGVSNNKNLQVWEVASGKLCWEFHQRAVGEESWPAIHWDENETLAFHMVKNTIHAYDPTNGFQGAVCKLPLVGVAGFTVSPGAHAKIAAYVAESKSQPATVGIFPVSDLPRNKTAEPRIMNRKSFYRVSGVTFLWNSTGSAVLCNSYSDVDVSNQSYYGEQHLYFMAGNEEEASVVPNLEKGPIHDVQWSPKGDFFAVVAGFMPAKTMLFNAKCKPIFDLGSGPHNMIRWNPHGRFLCVAGFGNLPGDIVFWDKKNNGTCRRISTVRCPSVTMEWSPCGRHLLTSITAPRLRVDNAFKVYTYYGELVHQESFKELYEAQWVPAPVGQYPDRPASPGRIAGKSVASAPAAQEAQASAYVPPHLRGRSTRSSAAQFSLGHSTDQGGRIKSEAQQPKGPEVPGATFVGKAASKNAKRRAKKAAQKQEGGNDNGKQQEDAPPEKEQVVAEALGPPEPAAVQQVTEGVACLGAAGADEKTEDPQKRIRNLRKKLRQIDTLKEKVATAGKESLAKEQLEKLAGEDAIRRELRSLGDTG